MTDRIEQLRTSDGTMELFIAHPEGPRRFPLLIQLMDGVGMREELCGHARRTASWGYCVIAPDLFYRSGVKGPLEFSDPEGRRQMLAAVAELTDARAVSDIEAVISHVRGTKIARPGKVGLYGFCLGGRLALALSQALGDQIAAAASIHPGNLVTEATGSPHRHLDNVRAELYFGIADKDATATPEQMTELEKELTAKDICYQLEWHAGALHGFMMPSRPLYNEAAAQNAWRRMKSLFARTLQ